MESRLKLQTILEDILGSGNVYFQPPSSVKMSYPAIVYSRSDMRSTFADNSLYKMNDAYTVTLIYDDPDSVTPRRLLSLPMCRICTAAGYMRILKNSVTRLCFI